MMIDGLYSLINGDITDFLHLIENLMGTKYLPFFLTNKVTYSLIILSIIRRVSRFHVLSGIWLTMEKSIGMSYFQCGHGIIFGNK